MVFLSFLPQCWSSGLENENRANREKDNFLGKSVCANFLTINKVSCYLDGALKLTYPRVDSTKITISWANTFKCKEVDRPSFYGPVSISPYLCYIQAESGAWCVLYFGALHKSFYFSLSDLAFYTIRRQQEVFHQSPCVNLRSLTKQKPSKVHR